MSTPMAMASADAPAMAEPMFPQLFLAGMLGA